MEECTCETETIKPHECPFKVEINGNHEKCRCCKECKDQCRDNI